MSLGGSYNFTEIDDPSLSAATCRSCTVTDPKNAAGNTIINGNALPLPPVP